MAAVNRPGYPISGGGEGKLPSRSVILNRFGGMPIFFGPGQLPTCVGTYRAPTDWPPAGHLLRVPQVVWLSAYFGYPTEMAPTHNIGTLFTPVILENKTYEELVRVNAVLAAVKAAVEAVRPHRTYVYVVPWHTADLQEYTFGTLSSVQNVVQVQTPDADAEFFGTDFLHVCCGDLAVNMGGGSYFAPYSASYPTKAFPFAKSTVAAWVAASSFSDARADIVGAYEKFRRYATWLYPEVLDWSGALLSADMPDHRGANTIATFNAHSAANLAVHQGIASELADYGFEHKGTSAAVTAALSDAIAEHFGYDPGTGEDLP